MKKAAGGGGDTVLESRHVVGMFLAVVVLCGIFFTLGYVMGRTQYDGAVRAMSPAKPVAAPKPVAESAPVATSPDFFRAMELNKATEKPSPAKPPVGVSSKPTAPASSTAIAPTTPRPTPSLSTNALAEKSTLYQSPAVPRNHIVLQVAALHSEADALLLAEELQRKQFPAYVLTPATGNLFRVQVGPYPAAKADAARKALAREGFKPITKR